MVGDGSILVTGAAGRLGSVGRTVTGLLLDRGFPVRAMVRREDERAASLRAAGAQVVVGDLLEPGDVYRVVSGCGRVYFGMSVSAGYLEATVTMAAVAREAGVNALTNMSQMTVSEMSIQNTTPSHQQRQHWLSEQVLAWNREVTYSDISPEEWEQRLRRQGMPEHLTGHLLAMGELHRAGRYDRRADGVQRVTGRPAMSVREFVSLYAEEFGGRRS
jgi:NADPH:quinone reductase-like Zn-dependent oxidoreductase